MAALLRPYLRKFAAYLADIVTGWADVIFTFPATLQSWILGPSDMEI
jgi:hypothetical protein